MNDDWKINRSFSDFIHFLISQNCRPVTVIDVGACSYGTPQLQPNLPEAYHIFIEPNPALEPRMQVLLEKYRGEYHMVALSDCSGVMPLRIPKERHDCATLLPVSIEDGEPKDDNKTIVNVPVTTLDELLGDRQLERPALLKTDCQGLDLNVIKGARQTLSQFDIVIMEVLMFHVSREEKTPVFSDIVCAMRDRGYEVYDIVSYQTRPLDVANGFH